MVKGFFDYPAIYGQKNLFLKIQREARKIGEGLKDKEKTHGWKFHFI